MKEVILSMEEWQRLAAISSEDRDKAMRFLSRQVHHEIIVRGFSLDSGPFSRAAIGGNAVEISPMSRLCFRLLFWSLAMEKCCRLL